MNTDTKEPLKGIKVLLVDDSRTIVDAGKIILSKEGASVITAMDGFAAMHQVNTQKPDIVFLDIQMPKLDGYQCCSLIKNSSEHKDTPVIILSGNDGMFDRARARVAGCDDHLAKPINREEIIKSIKMLVNSDQLAA